jgi:uncharacterized SAM-binding protein YcdF (DUF218 family)
MGSTGDTTAGTGAQAAPRRDGRLGRWVRRLYRLARATLALTMLVQILLVATPVPYALRGWLDVTSPPRQADVILCLGGSDDRLVWAAELFQQGFAPLIVVSNKPGAAEVMKMRAVSMGVPADRVLVDDQSRVTADHPGSIAKVPGIDPARQRFLIVTNVEHSRRAAACFRRAGYRDFSVCALSPVNHEHSWRGRVVLLPQLAYEYAALVQYWLQGKI